MSDLAPEQTTGIDPGGPSRPGRLAVDPSLLAAAAPPLLAAGHCLRAAIPAMRWAWNGAAHVLAAQRTGQALAASQASGLAALDACAESVEALGAALQRAAARYDAAESGAVLRPGPSLPR